MLPNRNEAPIAKVTLFVRNKENENYQITVGELKKIMEALQEQGTVSIDIVDASTNPERALQAGVFAFPTIKIGSHTFVGRPRAERILSFFGISAPGPVAKTINIPTLRADD